MATGLGQQSVNFEDVLRINDLSDDEKFMLSLDCGEYFGPDDIRVKVVAGENRLVIEGSKSQMTCGVQEERKISYEHDLPDGVDTQKVTAGWDPNDGLLIVEAPITGQGE